MNSIMYCDFLPSYYQGKIHYMGREGGNGYANTCIVKICYLVKFPGRNSTIHQFFRWEVLLWENHRHFSGGCGGKWGGGGGGYCLTETTFDYLNDVANLCHNAFAMSASLDKTVFVFHFFEGLFCL